MSASLSACLRMFLNRHSCICGCLEDAVALITSHRSSIMLMSECLFKEALSYLRTCDIEEHVLLRKTEPI